MTLVLSLITFVVVAPHFYYNDIVNNGEMNSWFTIPKYSEKLVVPKRPSQLNLVNKNINEKLWKRFHFKTLLIPMPVKNPFYFVSPTLEYNKENKNTEFGVSIYDANNQLLSQIYFLPKFSMPKILNSQKIFELPIVSNYIKKQPQEKVWNDLFTKNISSWDISFKDMFYHLYLLQLRSKLINSNVLSYEYITDIKKAILTLDFVDKDFISELVLSRRGNDIYPYIINTRVENKSAANIKFKMLRDISFQDTTATLADIIYQEFKSLEFFQQIDEEGMLYLLSAWSHNQKRLEIIASAIQYLERGTNKVKQLEPLYKYIYSRTGRTYSKKSVRGLNLSPEILLKKNIELENAIKKTMEQEVETPEEVLSVKEQYEKILNETRQNLKEDENTMRMN